MENTNAFIRWGRKRHYWGKTSFYVTNWDQIWYWFALLVAVFANVPTGLMFALGFFAYDLLRWGFKRSHEQPPEQPPSE